LLPALKRAFGLPRFSRAASRTIIIMTDGYVSVEQESFDLVRNNLGEGNVFVFGIGDSVNRYIVEGLARVGYGEPFVVPSREEGEKVADKFRQYIDTPVLTRLWLTFEGPFAPKAMEPPYLPDVFASRPVQVVGKYEGELKGKITLTGLLADGSSWTFSRHLEGLPSADVASVPLLWARSRIAILGDYAGVSREASNEAEITELGLNYSLMTKFTSFIAVDTLSTFPDACKVQSSIESSEKAQQNIDMQIEKEMNFQPYGAATYFVASGTSRPAVFVFALYLFAFVCWSR